MKKTVWILNHYAKPPREGGGTRHFHLAENLRKQGWKAEIIAADFSTDDRKSRLHEDESSQYEIIDEVPFLWIKTPTYTGNGAGRMKNMLAYSWGVLNKKNTKSLPKPDVIIGSSVHPFAALAGAILAKRYKVPFIFEVRDLWPQTLIDMGRLKASSPIAFVLRKLEGWLYKKASKTIVLLPYAWDYIKQFSIKEEQVVWVPNGVEMELYPDEIVSQAKDFDKDSFTLMYFGAHGQANGLDVLIEAMSLVQKQDQKNKIQLRMIGSGPLKDALRNKANELSLSNVVFEEPVFKKDIPKLAAEANAFVITVLDLPELYRYGISMNKLFDYLASARPTVIASAAANNPVADANAGITVPPEDAEALAEGILQLAAMSHDERKQLGRNGRKYVVQNHSFEELGKKLAKVLDEAIRLP